MKLLLLTDSLALPREIPEFCSFEDTWPQLLKNEGYIVHQVSIGGGTISDLVHQSKYHKLFNPDVLILQSGIVDCSPRFMSKFEQKIVRQIPKVSTTIFQLFNKPKVRKFRKLTYTPLAVYEKKLNELKEIFKCKVLPIGIGIKSREFEELLPNITTNIESYNKILKNRFSTFIDISDMPTDFFMSDFHHLNKRGHEFLCNRLLEKLNA